METKQIKLVSEIAKNLSSDSQEDLEVSKVIESFKKDFLLIKNKDFVKSNRKHNTGIGKTFEDLIGINENNNRLADYKDILELKSTRELSNNMVTLFTEKPTYPVNANAYFRDTFGQPDPKFPHVNILHTTISSTGYNTFKNELGFKLEVNFQEEKIYIRTIDLRTKELVGIEVYYTFDKLREIIEKKCKYIAYINAETKEIDGAEHFYFKSAVILTGLTFEKFLSCIDNGLIKYDIRIGCNQSGRNIGKSHDHGSGMRIEKKNIDKVFHKIEL